MAQADRLGPMLAAIRCCAAFISSRPCNDGSCRELEIVGVNYYYYYYYCTIGLYAEQLHYLSVKF